MAAITAGVIGAAGLALTLKGQQDAKTAASRAAQAAKDSGVNIPQVASQAHDQAIKNAYDSAALEKQLNPLAPQLRTQSLQAIIDSLKGGPNDKAIQSSLYDQFNQAPAGTPAFADYGQSQLSQAAQDEAMKQLALGGKLDQETANQVIRSSAARAGGYGNTLGLGRDLSARDLGLTSLQLQQQRLGTAQQFGQAQDAFTAQHAAAQNSFGLNSAQLQLQAMLQRANLGFGLSAMSSDQLQRALAAGQFGQSIAQPQTGLDPSAIANLAVGNSNSQQSGAQNAYGIAGQIGMGTSQLGGQLLGFGSTLYNNYARPQQQQLPAAGGLGGYGLSALGAGASAARTP